LNINGIDGPTLKKVFTCDGCKYLSTATLNGITSKYQYKCYHDSIISKNNRFNIMAGDITSDKITPEFCPFLLIKIRNEKLKELNDKVG
jgi:hypothetical protein